MFRVGKNGGRKHLFSMYRIKVEAFSSTNLLPEFLVNSIGFSREQAICASAKVTPLKPGHNKPALFLNYLKQLGFDNTHIRMLVSPAPSLLFADVDKTLKPKIKVLQDFGLSGPDLVRVLARSAPFLKTGLHTSIRPSLEYLRDLLGSDSSVVKSLKKSPALLRYRLDRVVAPNISLLRNVGYSTLNIERLFLRNPRIFVQKPEWLEDIIQRVENDFHISCDSWMFLYGVETLSSLTKPNLEVKLRLFRSFGWSDSDIITMVQRLPLCLTSSQSKLTSALKFFMEELGYGSTYVASHPTLLMFSLEKRVIPRNKISLLLKEKQLLKREPSFYTIMKCSESDFYENFVLPFKNETPEVYDFYMKECKLRK